MIRSLLVLCFVLYWFRLQVHTAKRQDRESLSVSMILSRKTHPIVEKVKVHSFISSEEVPPATPTENATSPTILHSIPRKENTTIDFFPWNDGYDYNAICHNLLSVFASFKTHKIVTSGQFGGLGHKFLTIFNALTAALVLGRPYFRTIFACY